METHSLTPPLGVSEHFKIKLLNHIFIYNNFLMKKSMFFSNWYKKKKIENVYLFKQIHVVFLKFLRHKIMFPDLGNLDLNSA